MAVARKRAYDSSGRKQRADETRQRIVRAARVLFATRGFGNSTIEAIAKKARVAAPTVYVAFGSKQGLLTAMLDEVVFGPDYDALVAAAQQGSDPAVRLRYAARIARMVHESTLSELDLLLATGASIEVLEFERERERHRLERQGPLVDSIAKAKRLKRELDATAAREILWALTGRELYRLLVRERKWTGERYETWLADTLCSALLAPES